MMVRRGVRRGDVRKAMERGCQCGWDVGALLGCGRVVGAAGSLDSPSLPLSLPPFLSTSALHAPTRAGRRRVS
jgi:hypothetical protein